MGTKAQLRKIVRVQRDDEIGHAEFVAGAERLAVRGRRNIPADSVRNSFCWRVDEMEGRADVVRADAAVRRNLLVSVHDR